MHQFLLKFSVNAWLATFILFSLSTLMRVKAADGVIHFTGQIVEEPCFIDGQQQQVTLSCEKNGHRQTRHFSTRHLEAVSRDFQQVASVNMTYLDKQKSLAVMTVEYR